MTVMRASPLKFDAFAPSSPEQQRTRYSQELAEYSYQQYAAALKAAEATQRLKEQEKERSPKQRSTTRSPPRIVELGAHAEKEKTPVPTRKSSPTSGGWYGSGIAQAAAKAVDFALGKNNSNRSDGKSTNNGES